MTVRVLLVDDDALVRAGLAAIVGACDDLVVVGEAADGAEALSLALRVRPDVVVMDVRMPHVDGISATRLLRRQLDPAPRVLVVTTFDDDEQVGNALLAGASGFLLKRARADQFRHAIRVVADGESVLFPAAIGELVTAHTSRRTGTQEDPRVRSLTPREADVLRSMAQGLSNAEIGAHLHLGTETVKSHVAALLAKLGVRDRTQAVVMAFQTGFVVPR
ncbi:MAG: response regulator transcription factor [Kineosporiaceae bacterium]